MTNRKYLFSVAVFGFFALLAVRPANADTQTIHDANNAVWASVGTAFLNYKEPSGAPYLPDSEHGWISSLAGGVGLMGGGGRGILNNVYFVLETSGNFGSARYNGAYLNSPFTPLQGSTNETIWTVDSRLGRGFVVAPAFMLTPFVELGHRYWGRNLGPGQTETYQNFDTLGGLMAQISPTNRLVLTGYGSFGPTIQPQMHTGGYTYDLGTSGMYKLGGKVGFDVLPQVEIFTTLDYDYFRYGQSGAVADGSYEPNSKTEESTWRVGAAYHFK